MFLRCLIFVGLREVYEVRKADHGAFVPSEHGLDCFGQLHGVGLVDAYSVDPDVRYIAPSGKSATILDFCPALAIALQALLKVLERWLVLPPCVREYCIFWCIWIIIVDIIQHLECGTVN